MKAHPSIEPTCFHLLIPDVSTNPIPRRSPALYSAAQIELRHLLRRGTLNRTPRTCNHLHSLTGPSLIIIPPPLLSELCSALKNISMMPVKRSAHYSFPIACLASPSRPVPAGHTSGAGTCSQISHTTHKDRTVSTQRARSSGRS